MVTLDIHVDPYYMLGSREEMTTSSAVHLWYYGEFDSCDRPANKWNARSTSRDIRFTFLASKGILDLWDAKKIFKSGKKERV